METETINNEQTFESVDDTALAEELKERYDRVRTELKKLIIGQDDVVELVLLTLLAGGNSLIVGVPGLAKTLLIHTIAQVLDQIVALVQ